MTNHWKWHLCALPLLLCGLFLEFMPETVALAWHVRYGRSAKLGNYNVPVPLSWVVLRDEGGWDLWAGAFPGRFRGLHLGKQEWGTMSFSIAPNTSGTDRLKAMPRMDDLLGTHTTVLPSLTVAGQPTLCFQRTRPSHSDIIEIDCAPESDKRGFAANFMGNEKFVDVFLELCEA